MDTIEQTKQMKGIKVSGPWEVVLVAAVNIVLNKFKKKKKEVDIMAKNAYISRVSYQLVY